MTDLEGTLGSVVEHFLDLLGRERNLYREKLQAIEVKLGQALEDEALSTTQLEHLREQIDKIAQAYGLTYRNGGALNAIHQELIRCHGRVGPTTIQQPEDL